MDRFFPGELKITAIIFTKTLLKVRFLQIYKTQIFHIDLFCGSIYILYKTHVNIDFIFKMNSNSQGFKPIKMNKSQLPERFSLRNFQSCYAFRLNFLFYTHMCIKIEHIHFICKHKKIFIFIIFFIFYNISSFLRKKIT